MPSSGDDTVAREPAPAEAEDTGRRFGLSLWLCGAVIAGDQLSKALIRSSLSPFESRTIIPGVLDFIHVQNTGVAFGILNDAVMNQRVKAVLTKIGRAHV